MSLHSVLDLIGSPKIERTDTSRSSRRLKMNYNKLNTILTVIKNSDLPRDRWGHILSYQDLIVWYGLNESLEPDELEYMKKRLAEMVEIQNAIEMMKLPQF